MITVGYIGLGLMGKSMACNLLKAGFPVVVYNRSRPAVDELVALGAFAANSPAEVARKVKIVITNLPDTPDVLKVVLGENGIIHGARNGLIYIDNSTIKPDAAREIAEKLAAVGVASLDAPVSGGDIGAREGTLTIMVGGPKAALETAMPVLKAMGKTITHIGDAGAGQIAKAANQIMVSAQMVAMGELLVFAQKCGTDPRRVVEALRGGAASCWALDVKPQRLFIGNRAPGFKAKMQSKDLGIVMETARAYGVSLPGTAIGSQLFQAMVDNGLGEMDNSAVISIIEMLTGEKLQEDGSSSVSVEVDLNQEKANNNAKGKPVNKELGEPEAKKVTPSVTHKSTSADAIEKHIAPLPSAQKENSSTSSPNQKKDAQQATPAKKTPPFIDVDQKDTNKQQNRIPASKTKTTPLKG